MSRFEPAHVAPITSALCLTQWVIVGLNQDVRVLVLCTDPDRAEGDPNSAVSVLLDLGCRLTTARLDLSDLDTRALAENLPDIAVIDAGDHLEPARRCRSKMLEFQSLAEIPTLLLVTVARLAGLDFGVGFDDFALQPLVPAELYARLRQLDWRTAAFRSEELIKIDDVVIDVAGYEVRLGGRRIEFTHQEYELLRHLAQNRGRVFTRDQLLQSVWGYPYPGSTRTVDIHVRRLRAKLGPAADLIETVRNVGYKLRGADPD